jgi:hypothetical protein
LAIAFEDWDIEGQALNGMGKELLVTYIAGDGAKPHWLERQRQRFSWSTFES